MLKLFSSGSSSLMRTFLLVGLILGSLGVAIASQQLSLVNVRAAATLSKHDGYAPNVSINIESSIDLETVTYRLTIRNAAHGGIIRKSIPILFTDIIPRGLSNISTTGYNWDTKVRTTARPMVTGVYRGSYPVPSNTTLPAITITATITSDAGNMLTNFAAVHVQGNSDQTHSQATVHDNIESTSPSGLSLNNDSSTCNSNCSNQNSSICASNNDQISNNQCDQQSVQTSVQRSVYISAQESVDTSCQCDQQKKTSNGHNRQNSNPSPNLNPNNNQNSNPSPNLNPNNNQNSNPSPNLSPSHSLGKGSTDPFPTLPNTGSKPLLT